MVRRRVSTSSGEETTRRADERPLALVVVGEDVDASREQHGRLLVASAARLGLVLRRLELLQHVAQRTHGVDQGELLLVLLRAWERRRETIKGGIKAYWAGVSWAR